jgi:general secretion pathway protein A
MHEEYYGFTEKPFSLTPDPKYLYKSESHANAFDLLQYAIRRREGFVLITGDIGTGKTTLCRAILEQLDRRTFTALVLNPFLSEEDLLRLILQDFGVVSREEMKRGRLAGVSKQELIDTLNDFLMSLLPLHAGAVLILDEAQNLPRQVLEQIRILSNLETDKEKLLQIVLVGQLNLKELLRSPDLRQLDQRISIRYELKPLTREETSAYIAHRLTIAGGGAVVNFFPKALDLVHRFTGGIPRLINLLCDRALLGGYSARTNKITPEMVTVAANTLELTTPRGMILAWLRRRAMPLTAVAAALIAIVAVAAYSVILLHARSASARVQENPPAAVESQNAISTPSALAHPAEPVRPSPPEAASSQPPEGTAGSGSPVAAVEAAPSDPAKYSVQVGSFRQETEAGKLTEQLRATGYRVRIVRINGMRGLWHQVLIGPYVDLDEARQHQMQVRQMPGYADARLVTH